MNSIQLGDRRNIKKLILSAVTMFLCLVVLLCAALAWFSMDSSVSAVGKGIAVQKTLDLKIAKTQNGEDIATFSSPDNLFATVFNNNTINVYPGSSGSFDMFLSVTNEGYSGGSITLKPEIIPGGTDSQGNIIAPYRTEYDSASAEQAVNYMQGHILLFTNLTDGIYSGWLDIYNGTQINFLNNQQIRIYWIWIDYYYKFYTENLSIDKTDLAKIQSYFMVNNEPKNPTNLAFTNLLDKRNNSSQNVTLTRLGHFYDFGDEMIGRMINTFSFNITYSNLH